MNDSWLKQSVEQPLFGDMLWSKPENKRLAGKLLIIGGSVHGFAQTVSLYQSVIRAGVGTVRVVLPDSLRSTLGNSLEDIDYVSSNRSGGFAERSLADLLEQSSWSDGVIFGPELDSNSEDKLLFEKFIHDYSGQLTLVGDPLNFLIALGENYFSRKSTLVVGDLSKLSKLAVKAKSTLAINPTYDLVRVVDAANMLSKNCSINILSMASGNYLLSINGTACTTKEVKKNQNWETDLAGHGAVWWVQHPDKVLEALSCALVEVQS
ncbi:MAG TPA: hypothetical protein VMR34_01230 [Candidatus Saccharimonadales bacterium]|nr:hypothetical protein [Candidatus Saccharimonadales bacterium]